MWNERYASDQYIYGTDPNQFLAEHAELLQSPVLSIGEGEGRNAVFLAGKGFDVLGVDGSEIGLAKAQALAKSRGVGIRTEVCDLALFRPEASHYGAVVSIFAHLPTTLRTKLYPRLIEALTPGGVILLEAYSEKQINRDTGGPKDLDMLMTPAKIMSEFPGMEIISLNELEREVCEGSFHTGSAIVVQFIGKKR